MSYLKTIVRFVIRNPGAVRGSRDEFSPLRDERPLGSSFMKPNSESGHALLSEFREGTDMGQVSSADFTYPQGYGGASEYFLNNIDLDKTTPVELYGMINLIVQVLQQATTLLDGKRITKMYATDRENGTNEDAFYQHMTNGTAVPLRTLVSPLVGLPMRPLVIVVVLEQASGGSKRKSRRTRKSKRKSHRR